MKVAVTKMSREDEGSLSTKEPSHHASASQFFQLNSLLKLKALCEYFTLYEYLPTLHSFVQKFNHIKVVRAFYLTVKRKIIRIDKYSYYALAAYIVVRIPSFSIS